MAQISLQHIQKIYPNNVHVVKDFCLEIEDKEFIVFVGPSGCGKSTTLRMIAGLEEISDGDLLIDGQRMNDVAAKNRGIAMVFQNYALYPHMSVYDNMAFALKLMNVDKAEIERRVAYAAQILGLKDLLQRRPSALSGGQRQRVALGRAIVRDAKVFLMDEPLSNLDAKLRVQMRAEISKLHQKLDTTMIYVTHDQTEAMTMGDRICVMKLGHIMQVDTPDNLYHKPKNMFVAGFIGAPEMNIRKSVLVEKAGQLHIAIGDETMPLNAEKQEKVAAYAGQEIFFGVRPEFVSLSDEPFPNGGCSGEMVLVENMGHEFFVYLKVADYELTARIPSDEAKPMIDKGLHRKVYFTFDMNKCHIFDAKTEQNLSL